MCVVLLLLFSTPYLRARSISSYDYTIIIWVPVGGYRSTNSCAHTPHTITGRAAAEQ